MIHRFLFSPTSMVNYLDHTIFFLLFRCLCIIYGDVIIDFNISILLITSVFPFFLICQKHLKHLPKEMCPNWKISLCFVPTLIDILFASHFQSISSVTGSLIHIYVQHKGGYLCLGVLLHVDKSLLSDIAHKSLALLSVAQGRSWHFLKEDGHAFP